MKVENLNKKKNKVGDWNDKFKEFSTLQIKTAVYTHVAEYQVLCEELLLKLFKSNFLLWAPTAWSKLIFLKIFNIHSSKGATG